jgi:hypothetical protein
MTCSNTGASSARATSGGFGAFAASLLGLRWRGIRLPRAGRSGPAESTLPRSKPAGLSTATLYRRGLVLNNRDKEAALQYVLRHRTLAKGVCSDGF